jgi:hypothetical protein
MSQNAAILNRDLGPKDPEEAVKAFMKSSVLGRHNYISYAMSLGYKSIDVPDPDKGNTPLHLAVKNGHVQTVYIVDKFSHNELVQRMFRIWNL